MPNTQRPSVVLYERAKQSQLEANKLSAQLEDLTLAMANNPGDQSLITQHSNVAAQLTVRKSTVETLLEAVEVARKREFEDAKAAALKAAEADRKRVHADAAKRVQLAAKIDAQARALLEAIKAFREASAPIAETTKDVVRTVHGNSDILHFGHAMSLVMPHAAGTSGDMSQAAVEFIEELIAVLGADGLHQMAILNYTRAGVNFETAARRAAQNLGARL
jgi:hypothetical protein